MEELKKRTDGCDSCRIIEALQKVVDQRQMIIDQQAELISLQKKAFRK